VGAAVLQSRDITSGKSFHILEGRLRSRLRLRREVGGRRRNFKCQISNVKCQITDNGHGSRAQESTSNIKGESWKVKVEVKGRKENEELRIKNGELRVKRQGGRRRE
jgi:hypothetical protein